MHADELETDAAVVRRLLRVQFPEWAGLPIERVPSSGTDNALYRVGDELVARLPRIHWAVGGLEHELEWTPRLAPLLPVAVPELVAKGEPADGYPWPWAIYRWLEGENPVPGAVDERELARLVRAFRELELPDGKRTRRGKALVTQDAATRKALGELDGMIDTDAAEAVWDEALATPVWSDAPVWLHGDLLPGNLLARDGRLVAVIDFALVGVGDPACDLLPAWALLQGPARHRFRLETGVDDSTWSRGRGWALTIGLVALPYYKDTNPGFAAVARHLIDEVLSETNIRS
jgi:aminoglycoside phosphotransferase (APT) family kinase protein